MSPIVSSNATRDVTHYPALDGVRAVAALGVFFVHLGQAAPIDVGLGPFRLAHVFENGRLGVAMFLLLSGYCLALPLWNSPTQSRLERASERFVLRRSARILPLYWGVLLICMLRSPAQLLKVWDWLAHAAFVHNLWAGTLYSISEPFWAIAVIVQYYAVWWLLLKTSQACGFRSDRMLLWILCAGGAVLWCTNAVLDESGVAAAMFGEAVWKHGLAIHLPIFFLGAITAWSASRRLPASLVVSAEVVVVVGVLVLLGFMSCGLIRLNVPASRYGFPLVPLLFAAVLMVATQDGLVGRLLSSRVMVWGGSISYAFYLIHSPVIGLTKHGFEAFGGAVAPLTVGIGSLALSCAIAWTLTRAIGDPIQQFLRQPSKEKRDARR